MATGIATVRDGGEAERGRSAQAWLFIGMPM
jgi:hypothetical protein